MSKDGVRRERKTEKKSRPELWRRPTFNRQAEKSRRLRKPKKYKENHKSKFTEIKEGESI